MPESDAEFDHLLIKSRELYNSVMSIYNPYFKKDILFTAEGFNHLLYKSHHQSRTNREQSMKMKLLQKAIQILKDSEQFKNIELPKKIIIQKELNIGDSTT